METVLERFKKEYLSKTELKERIRISRNFAEIYFDSYRLDIQPILENDLQNSIEQNYTDGEVLTRIFLTYINFDLMDYPKAMDHIHIIEKKIHLVKDTYASGYAKIFLGYMHSHQGNYDAAFDLMVKAQLEYENFKEDPSYAWCIYGIAVIYFDLQDYDNSFKKYSEALETFRSHNYEYGIARSQTGVASVLIKRNKYHEAENLLKEALSIYGRIEMLSGQSRTFNDLGVISKLKGKPEEALELFKKALSIRRKTSHLQGIATTLNEIGDLLIETSREPEALPYLLESKELCSSINNKTKLYRAEWLLYRLYRNTGDLEKALIAFENYDKLKSEVNAVSSGNRIKELEKKMASEKAEKEAEIERIRNIDLRNAFDTIEQKNKEITDSINYAKRIQYALLANESLMKKNLPKHFILFQPKDIVSGDFYWATEKNASGSSSSQESTFYLAVCDSTGHGVPGAFMSLLNTTFLNEAINVSNIADCAKVFDYVREKLIENISQDGAKDGMDATLIKISSGNLKLEFAAANNYPIIIRKKELLELPFDKMPVGSSQNSKHFKLFDFQLMPGDMIYLGTDGYADQFGGEKFNIKKAGGKKFKKANLKKLLCEISTLTLEEQKNKLNDSFEMWRGDLEQVDDVLIIGIEI